MSIVLHANGGGAGDGIRGTYPVDLVPVQSLDPLAGEPADGSWTLAVADQAGGDTGTFEGWSLTVCPIEDATPEMKLRDLALADGHVQLSWWP
jgi:subtilisin-like proprotein convertase family protein